MHPPREEETGTASVDDLISVIQELSQVRQLVEIQRIVREAARRLTGADGATFVLREGDNCHYADEDAIEPLWKGRRFPLDACVSGWAMLHREPVVLEDIYADDRILKEAYRPTFVRSLAIVPIRSEDPIGAIGNYWAEQHLPTPREVSLLQALADATSVAMENVQVREHSHTDELTGVNNRRGFFALGQDAFETALAADARCAAVFVDLNGLKHVNDTYGHHAGSELIRETAAALESMTREGDIVGRLGGDELALLRPSGVRSADQLRAEITSAVARASRSDRAFGLAVSVGVAVERASEVGTLDELLARADEAMYEHKRAEGGRDGGPHVRVARRD